jgi:SAM-dependent methyltransferase
MNLIDRIVSRLAISKSIEDLSSKIDRLAINIEDYRKQSVDEIVRKDPLFNPAAAVGYRGDDSNRVYRGFIGDERPVCSAPAPTGFGSVLCRQVHFSLDQYRFWVLAMKERPKYLRKQWEFVYISQVLYERGMLAPGRRGLGFGVGREPLPALYASFGAEIVASDQSLEGAIQAGWVRSSEHSADLSGLNDRGICIDRMFNQLVSFAEVDMNAINPKFHGRFDFCWSACSLEHLGSLEHGATFIKNAMQVLKPGGVAVHTTEFNLTSNDATLESRDLSIYRRRDIDRLVTELAEAGHSPSPVDYSLGEGYAETVVDLPPFGRGEPHIRLRLADFDCTSIGLVVCKAT